MPFGTQRVGGEALLPLAFFRVIRYIAYMENKVIIIDYFKWLQETYGVKDVRDATEEMLRAFLRL